MQGFFSLFISASILLLSSSQASAAWEDVPDSQIIQQISAGPSQAFPNQLSLMTWNIQKAEGQSRWRKDFDALSASKNFILLQEGVEEPFIVEALKSVAEFGWFMARAFFLETDHKATGVITGASQESFSQSFLRSPDREPIAHTPKMALLTTYQMQDGTRLLVVNVHAINFTELAPFQRQMDQIAGMIRGWPERVILAGDFNTWSPNRTRYLRELMGSAGMTEVTFKEDPRNLVLDHIFLRGCSASTSLVRSDVVSSDHYPLTAELLCAN